MKQYFLNQLDTFWHNINYSIIEIVTISYVCYMVFNGYKMFFSDDSKIYTRIYVSTVIFIICKLLWKVVL
jgi:hypothetical protein